jgi:hypothetical protein
VRSVLLWGGLLTAGGMALAQTQGGNLPLVIGQGPGGNSYSVPIQTLLFFTALGFIPAVLLLMTAFTRIVIVLSLVFFAMQVQTFCDPLVVVTCSAAWRRYPDTQAALVTFALVAGYYVVVVVSFVIFLRATGQPWSSSVVAISDNVLTYLLITLLPGVGAVLIASRVLLLLYAQWPQGLDVSKLKIISFVLVDEIQAFRRIELLYLGRFYLLLWSLIAAVILGVLASRFSFIVPLLFYNKYVNA